MPGLREDDAFPSNPGCKAEAGEGSDCSPHFAEQQSRVLRKLSSMTPRFLPFPALCLVMCMQWGGWHQLRLQDKTLAHCILYPSPCLAPALPEALKGPDCAREVSERSSSMNT